MKTPEKTAHAVFGYGIRGHIELSIDDGNTWVVQEWSALDPSQKAPINGPGGMTMDLRKFPARKTIFRFVFEEIL